MKILRITLVSIMATIFFMVGFSSYAYAGSRYEKASLIFLAAGKKKNQQNNHQRQMREKKNQRQYREREINDRHQRYNRRGNRHDYRRDHNNRGYYGEPMHRYGTNHGHAYRYKHNGKHYNYSRHRTWKKWRTERLQPRYKRGHYHHSNGFLMFSYCNDDNNLCFSISLD
jgi:hypothetical protein